MSIKFYITNADGKRVKITLDQMPKDEVNTIKTHIKKLNVARITNTAIPRETAVWVSEIGLSFHKRLSALGLVEPRNTEQPQPLTLNQFLTDYIASKLDITESTRINLQNTQHKLVRYFSNPLITSITEQQAAIFKSHLAETLAKASVSKHIKHTKEFFRYATKKKLIVDNPFADIIGGSQSNDKRHKYITMEIFFHILKFCNDDLDLQTALICYRCLGMRFSEPASTLWGNINWTQKEIEITSPKTQRYGKGSRVSPIYPPAHQLLLDIFNKRKPSPTSPLVRINPRICRKKYINLLIRAKVPQYPRLFHNLRSSLITQLCLDHYSIKSISKWCGCSEHILIRHYQQETETEKNRAKGENGKAVG